ncbi:hypothetical protein [Virgibacillus oceani]|uniref:RNA polymerase sigma-70 region 2 domain-containing protein n=1 Tax=Virgibacillus oceani TaxID=1479511 RepID=A0A917HHY2_9BACI|nr:hypothetical protein [Virgibacillus oceani]GGG79900.1 hypothetical protein GCM10011398_26530 [Virgibacillus oceani]
MKNHKITFEEIRNQNKRRVQYHNYKLNVKDSYQERHQEGLVTMWNAYERYHPDNGLLATYFNYVIRKRMFDLTRQKKEQVYEQHNAEHKLANHYHIKTINVAEDSQVYNT